MITDAMLLLSNEQSLAVTAQTVLSTNTIDLGSVTRDIGAGHPLFVAFSVSTAFTGGTSVKAEIIVSAAAALTSPVVVASSRVFTDAQLVAGFAFNMAIPSLPDGDEKRYLGVQFVSLGDRSAGTGKITAQVSLDAMPEPKNYASGYAVQT